MKKKGQTLGRSRLNIICTIQVLVFISGLASASQKKNTSKGAQKQSGLVLVALLMQPASDDLSKQLRYPSVTFTAVEGSYVDWVQSAGAEAVLLPFDIELDIFRHILDNVQAVLLPGGDAQLLDQDGEWTAYQDRLKFVLDYAKRKNDQGQYYPVIGTCLGLESIVLSETGPQLIPILQGGFTDRGVAHSIQSNSEAIKKTRLWSKFVPNIIEKVLSGENFFYYHAYGLTPEVFKAQKPLAGSYSLIGTSKDTAGHEFIASIEHSKYPIIAFQFHPEANLYNRVPGPVSYLDRSASTVAFSHSVIMTVLAGCRANAQQYANIPDYVKRLMSMFQEGFLNIYDQAERFYLLPRTTSDRAVKESLKIRAN